MDTVIVVEDDMLKFYATILFGIDVSLLHQQCVDKSRGHCGANVAAIEPHN